MSEAEPQQLTPRDKYHCWWPGKIVLVKAISLKGREPVWILGRIKETNKGGAACVTAQRKTQFFHWRDITEPEFDPPDDALPALSIAKTPPPPMPTAPVLRLVPTPAPPQLMPPPPPQPEVPAPESAPASEARPKDTRTMAKKQSIGDRIREYRSANSLSQGALGELLSTKTRTVSNARISQIETGKSAPVLAELEALAKLMEVDVSELQASSDSKVKGKRRKRRTASVEQDGPTKKKTEAGFAVFVGRLCTVVPMPQSSRGAEEWIDLAMKLYKLGA